MRELILALGIIFIFSTILSVGIYSLEKYKKDNEISEVGFWKGLFIVFGYSVFSITIIIPVAIAKWAVDLTVNFKEE